MCAPAVLHHLHISCPISRSTQLPRLVWPRVKSGRMYRTVSCELARGCKPVPQSWREGLRNFWPLPSLHISWVVFVLGCMVESLSLLQLCKLLAFLLPGPLIHNGKLHSVAHAWTQAKRERSGPLIPHFSRWMSTSAHVLWREKMKLCLQQCQLS